MKITDLPPQSDGQWIGQINGHTVITVDLTEWQKSKDKIRFLRLPGDHLIEMSMVDLDKDLESVVFVEKSEIQRVLKKGSSPIKFKLEADKTFFPEFLVKTAEKTSNLMETASQDTLEQRRTREPIQTQASLMFKLVRC